MLAPSPFRRALYEAAPILSKRYFSCNARCRMTDTGSRWAGNGVDGRQQGKIANGCVRGQVRWQSTRMNSASTWSGNVPARGQKTNNALSTRTRCGAAGTHHRDMAEVHARGQTRYQSTRQSSSQPTLLHARNQHIFSSTRGFRIYARLREAVAEAETVSSSKAKSTFPETSSNAVAYWLLASAASVFGIVVFGGLTRLTESGLSITEWKPVTGSLPPMSAADWEAEFTKYQASPEYRVLNSRMTLDEFKNIYWMEWIHRIWGRVVGLSFVLPAVYFIATKRVSKPMTLRLAGIAGLIGFQGFIGWWMVKSGLKDDLFQKPGTVPRVSQYRLAAHLGTAFICYLAMLWNGLSILRTNKLLSLPTTTATSQLFALRNPALRPFKISIALLLGLTFTTAMSGALVAGLDAGLIYNEFPYMGLGLTPPRAELFDAFYAHKPDQSDLVWRNFLENPSLVQLDHRILATTTFSSVMALWAYTKYNASMKAFLPRNVVRGVHGVVGFVWLQVILGISTLIYMVPLPLASAHQAGALALLTWTTVLGSRIWVPKAAARILQQRVGQKAASYDFPGIGKTGARTETAGLPVVQASFGAAGAAVGSVLLASVMDDGTNSKSAARSSDAYLQHLDDAKLEYLQRQSGKGCAPR